MSSGAGGTQASEPERIQLLEQLFFRAAHLQTGDEYRSGTESRVRFVIDNYGAQESPCSRLTTVELLVTHAGATESFPMLGGKRNPGPPSDISPPSGTTGSSSRTTSSSGSYLEGSPEMWWSDWLNIPGGGEVEAHVTYGDGEQAGLRLDRPYRR